MAEDLTHIKARSSVRIRLSRPGWEACKVVPGRWGIVRYRAGRSSRLLGNGRVVTRPKNRRGVEQRQLVGLITQRSRVRAPPPQPFSTEIQPRGHVTRGICCIPWHDAIRGGAYVRPASVGDPQHSALRQPMRSRTVNLAPSSPGICTGRTRFVLLRQHPVGGFARSTGDAHARAF